MILESFIAVLVISAATTSIGIEIIKNMLDLFSVKYKTTSVAIIIAFIVGFTEIIVHTISVGLQISYTVLIYALCMGAANAMGSNVGYDKVKAFIYSLNGQIN